MRVWGLNPLTACRFETAKPPGLFQTQVFLWVLQVRAGSSCRTQNAGNYSVKWHPRVIICSLPTTGFWGFLSLSSVSLVSRLFFHVEVIHFVLCAAEGFRWGNESARSARADKRDAYLISITHSALSTGMYYFFCMCSHTWGECGRTKCHHYALWFCRWPFYYPTHTPGYMQCGCFWSQDLCRKLMV